MGELCKRTEEWRVNDEAEAKALIEKAKADGSLKDVKLTFAIVNEETMEVTEKAYKVAFVKNNRPIDNNKVDGFIAIIAKGKYEKAYPIIAVSAKVLIENNYQVVDVDGNEVKEENADDYIVILDGQHRTKAFLECSITNHLIVPNTHTYARLITLVSTW